jgi:hypothetical protein
VPIPGCLLPHTLCRALATFRFTENSLTSPQITCIMPPSCPMRGASRESSRTLVQDAVDAMMSRAPLARDERHSLRTAKSCGPDARNAGVKSSGGRRLPAAMVARGSDSPGRARISRQAIAQGRPECSRFTCMLVCAFLCASMHTRPRVQRAPGLPCALFVLGAEFDCKPRAQCVARMRGCVRSPHERSDMRVPDIAFAHPGYGKQPAPGVMGPRVGGDDQD